MSQTPYLLLNMSQVTYLRRPFFSVVDYSYIASAVNRAALRKSGNEITPTAY